MGSPVGYTLGYSINMLLGLALENSFRSWEGYLVVVSLVPLDGLVIGTGEGYLAGLSLRLPLGYPLDSPNPVLELPGMIL